ncbi:hypothetical protein BsWGS_15168 [Bradybaena similaris]
MLRQHSHIIVMVLSAMFVVTCIAESLVSLDEGTSLTECSFEKRVSLVCYQCAKRHQEDFQLLYGPCCRNADSLDNEIRQYCEAIFTEPPRRGG